jgi:hypothetical protein
MSASGGKAVCIGNAVADTPGELWSVVPREQEMARDLTFQLRTYFALKNRKKKGKRA